MGKEMGMVQPRANHNGRKASYRIMLTLFAMYCTFTPLKHFCFAVTSESTLED